MGCNSLHRMDTQLTHLNLHIHPNTYPEKLKQLRKTSRNLVRNFTTLGEIILKRNLLNTISFEWPKGALEGWSDNEVIKMIKTLGLIHVALFDGCMLGVASKAPQNQGGAYPQTLAGS